MGKGLRRAIGFAVGVTAAWTFAVKPRIFNKPDMGELRKYDLARGGFHDLKKGIPENSVPAFEEAISRGYGILADVRLTRDGVPVVFRDSRLPRLCSMEGAVENSTKEELEELQISGTEEKIPSLQEVLDLIDSQVPVIFRLHVEGDNYRSLCERVCALLDEYEGVFALESVDPRVLRWFKEQREEYIRGQVLDPSHKSGYSYMNMIWDFFCGSLLMNFLTGPDYISCSSASKLNPSLWLCRLVYRIQMMDWSVKSFEEYENAKTGGMIAVFENIEP